MLYGAAVWDPWLIIAQIISIQCLFYITLGLWQLMFVGPYVGRLTVVQLLGWKVLSFRSYIGAMSMLSNLATSVLGAMYLMWIVERAKKCLDFASTCFIIHLGAVCWYSGFPASLEWWATNTIGLLIMSLLGEWLCVRREMQDIPLSSLRAASRSRAVPAAGASGSSTNSSSATSAAAAPEKPAAQVQALRVQQLQMSERRVSQSGAAGGGSGPRVNSTTRLLASAGAEEV